MFFSTPVNGKVGLFQSMAAGGDCVGLAIGLFVVKYCWMVVVFVAGNEDLGDGAVDNIFWRCC